MQRVSVKALKAQASEVLRGVEKGETIIVTRRGRPIARLEPIVPPPPQRQMGLRGLYSHLAPALQHVDLQTEIRELRQASTAHVENKNGGVVGRGPR